MSLTLTQRAKVRMYLGYPDQFRYEDTRLESILSNDLSAEGETLVVEALASIATIEVAMITVPLENAGIKRIDEVWFKDTLSNSTLIELKGLARPYINRISIIMGVPIYADAFGTQGYPGDSFSEFGGMSGAATGRGGMIRLG